MCLSSVDFALTWDNGGHAFVGYGYKKVYKSKLDRYLKWSEASCQKGKSRLFQRNKQISATDLNNYIPGFHIFTTKEAAQNYGQSDSKVVKVKYKDILGFGKNGANGKQYNCVIARYMKIVEIYE